MSIDDKLTERERNKQQVIAYARAQCEDMKATYNLMYARDGDHGTGLSFKDFLPVYIEHGHAKRFHELNYHKYFKEETK